jgi:cytochrome c-type protein NapC
VTVTGAILAGAGLAATLVALILVRPGLVRSRGGPLLAFLALFLFPSLLTLWGASAHLESSKSTQFCLSCHVMQPYGSSLHLADEAALPAAHVQNRRIPPEQACYSCHTNYTMFGGLNDKLRGFRHLWINYVSGAPEPAAIELYEPYHNRECLHCHADDRGYPEAHEGQVADLAANASSCLECHDVVHEIDALATAERYEAPAE